MGKITEEKAIDWIMNSKEKNEDNNNKPKEVTIASMSDKPMKTIDNLTEDNAINYLIDSRKKKQDIVKEKLVTTNTSIKKRLKKS